MHTEPSQLLAVLILTCTVRMVTFANEYNGRKGKKERGKKKKAKGHQATAALIQEFHFQTNLPTAVVHRMQDLL